MSAHNFCCLVFSLWSLIAGIVTLILNDKSPCAESHQTLMVLGIGLIVFSVLYIINSCLSSTQEIIFPFLVSGFVIFVFVLDCMLIDDMTRRNLDDDCSGGRGTLRWFIILWTVPFALTVCVFCSMIPDIQDNPDAFYGNSRRIEAEFQTLLL
jgi:amino acid permease